jgi:hypothetical protein
MVVVVLLDGKSLMFISVRTDRRVRGSSRRSTFPRSVHRSLNREQTHAHHAAPRLNGISYSRIIPLIVIQWHGGQYATDDTSIVIDK